MNPDYMKLVEALGASLVQLVPKRAKTSGEPSPGMVLSIDIKGQRYDLEQPLCVAILAAIDA